MAELLTGHAHVERFNPRASHQGGARRDSRGAQEVSKFLLD